MQRGGGVPAAFARIREHPVYAAIATAFGVTIAVYRCVSEPLDAISRVNQVAEYSASMPWVRDGLVATTLAPFFPFWLWISSVLFILFIAFGGRGKETPLTRSEQTVQGASVEADPKHIKQAIVQAARELTENRRESMVDRLASSGRARVVLAEPAPTPNLIAGLPRVVEAYRLGEHNELREGSIVLRSPLKGYALLATFTNEATREHPRVRDIPDLGAVVYLSEISDHFPMVGYWFGSESRRVTLRTAPSAPQAVVVAFVVPNREAYLLNDLREERGEIEYQQFWFASSTESTVTAAVKVLDGAMLLGEFQYRLRLSGPIPAIDRVVT